jgi:hypothetical protein
VRCESTSVVADAVPERLAVPEVLPRARAELAGTWVPDPEWWTAIFHIHESMLTHANRAP